MALTIVYTNSGASDITTSVLDGNKVVPAGGSITLSSFNVALDAAVTSGKLTRTVNGVSDNTTKDDLVYELSSIKYDSTSTTGVVKTISVLTQAQYDALVVKDPNTEYNIVAA